MIKNYLKIAIRNITKNKFFSLIKITSLAIGLSASFVIGLMAYYDLTFDKFHDESENIYRITSEFTNPDGKFYNSGVTTALSSTLKEDTPGLKVVAPLFLTYPLIVRNIKTNQLFKNPKFVVYADNGFFRLFDYNWLAGSKENILESPNEVVLTANRALDRFLSKKICFWLDTAN